MERFLNNRMYHNSLHVVRIETKKVYRQEIRYTEDEALAASLISAMRTETVRENYIYYR